MNHRLSTASSGQSLSVENFLTKVANREIGDGEAITFFESCSEESKLQILAALERAQSAAPLREAAPTPSRIRTNQNCSEAQKRFIQEFVSAHARKTRTSKALAAKHRLHLADQRLPANFNVLLKELQYPLTFERAEGAYLYDVDGNRYVDIAGDFGVNLFGHAPDFIRDALSGQIERGWALSGRYREIGEAAELFCELTGHERVAFCQSGTEALMCAVRLARAFTDRQKIVVFANSYHGHADIFLNPFTAGVSEASSQEVIALQYGDEAALDAIAEHAGDVAAVVVEPVQSDGIDKQPVEFLRRLRQLTRKRGIVLVFDEMITGFRAHPKGCQGLFGIDADLATYGKIVGGGITAGAVAGRADIMGWSDGGAWNYGDASKPGPTTYIAGTHTQNPLKMAATCAVLRELKRVSPDLQNELTRRTSALVERINDFAGRERLPFEAISFASQFKFRFQARQFTLTQALFLYLLRDRGINYYLHGNCFLNAAHSQHDIEAIFAAVSDSLALLRREDFFFADNRQGGTEEDGARPQPRGHGEAPRAVRLVSPAPAVAEPEPAPPQMVRARPDIAVLEVGKVIDGLCDLVGQFLELSPDEFDEDDELANLGVDSIIMTGILKAISTHFGVKLSLKKLDGAQTIAEVADVLCREIPLARAGGDLDDEDDGEDEAVAESEPRAEAVREIRAEAEVAARSSGGGGKVVRRTNGSAHADGETRRRARRELSSEDVAIVGMSVALPGAKNLRAYWHNLLAGQGSITEIPADRWDWRRIYSSNGEKGTSPSKWGGFIEGHDRFDPLFFKISPREAKYMDPQERLLLMHCHNALEDAGLKPSTLAGSATGVFIGYEYQHYADRLREIYHALPDPDPILGAMSGRPWYLANRLSFVFDWKGPSEAINVNCAASAVSISRACQSLAAGEADLAVAAGVCLNLTANSYLDVVELLSPDGSMRVFGEGANGYTKGEGCVVLLLKRLEDALADNTPVYCVVRACQQAYRGRGNSLSEVKSEAVAELIGRAHAKAGIAPSQLRYIEVNGYGSKKSDEAEYRGMKAAMAAAGAGQCGLGSVKVNVGNLEPASGAASVAKLALALENGVLPPVPEVGAFNAEIDLGTPDNPLFWQSVPVRLDDLRAGAERVCVGVNSFADSGVNMHIVLEEAGNSDSLPAMAGDQVFVVSAKSRPALLEYLGLWADYLRETPGVDMARLAFSMQIGRETFAHRFAAVASEAPRLLEQLEAAINGETAESSYVGTAPSDRSRSSEALRDASDLHDVARHWANGLPVDWLTLYRGALPQPLHQLPTYPFALKRYWLELPAQAAETESAPALAAAIEPVVAVAAPVVASVVASATGGPPPTPVAPPPVVAAATVPSPTPTPKAVVARPAAATSNATLDIMRRLRAIVFGFLEIDPNEGINEQANFAEIGLTSMSIVLLIDEVNREFGLELPEIIAFDYPNLLELSTHIASLLGAGAAPAAASTENAEPSSAPRGAPSLDTVLADLANRHLSVDQALEMIERPGR